MNKKAVLAGALLFALGLILIFCAASIGLAAGTRAIRAAGGAYDTEKYYFIIQSTALSCQIGGAVCALTGAAWAVFLGRRDGT